VVDKGDFDVFLKYNCQKTFAGSEMQISINDKKIRKIVSVPFTGKLYPSPDRVLRIEAYEKEWKHLKVGRIHLSKGFHKVTVSLAGGKPATPLELKSVLLQKR
jgi:arylsulfatase A